MGKRKNTTGNTRRKMSRYYARFLVNECETRSEASLAEDCIDSMVFVMGRLGLTDEAYAQDVYTFTGVFIEFIDNINKLKRRNDE
jgi:hypothetical protein